MKETWPIIFSFLSKIQIKIENLDRASGVQDRNRGLDEHFSKKFKNCPTLTWWWSSRSSGPRGCPSRPWRRRWRWRRCWWGRRRGWGRFECSEVEAEETSSLRVKKMFDFRFNLNKIKEKITRIKKELI